MIHIDEGASSFLKRIISQEGGDLNIRLEVHHAGTPQAQCQLALLPKGEESREDISILQDGFILYIAAAAKPFLEDASITLEDKGESTELNIRAPKIRGEVPASLQERIELFIETDINPMLAQHKGYCKLLEINDNGMLVLQFGGGCHGCGMVDITLKQGIEKQLKAMFPEVSGVSDATDHAKGENPYTEHTPSGSCHV